ncbi:DUF1328 domain-containing protein [Nitrosococcus wardiae]|uniref:UPF0391 membrane protein E3U44_03455 n=1 Tax=Nitrosococcus wardiae TaxID=1814290 RepID=A0A4P7C489_9GAMM|nr:DUF1328 domain-containing protein [Nitrosococcus wardiae]QBQ56434.1 DUF1328 domain-containing protein [Nitrosococcus wardiae]
MYGWATIIFLSLALVAAILRFMGIAWVTLEIVWILFIIGFILLVIFLIMRRASSAAQDQEYRDKPR